MKMQAVVDKLPNEGSYPLRKVTVTGDNGEVRSYRITGGSENSAVSEGMRRFLAEFEG